MTFTELIEDDLLVITADEPRTGRLFRRDAAAETDPPGTDAGEQVTGVHRVMLATDTMQGAGAVLPKGGARFHVQARQLAYRIPQPGDVYQDQDGRRYSLDRCEEADNGTRYVLTGTAER